MTATDLSEIKSTVKDFVLREFLPGEDPNELKDDTPLVTGGILDSLATVKLVSFLESRYGIEFAPYELSAEYIDTIDVVAALINSKRQS